MWHSAWWRNTFRRRTRKTLMVALVASIVANHPSVDGKKGLAARSVGRFFHVLRVADQLSTARLDLMYDDNTVEKGTTTRVTSEKTRPDLVVYASRLTIYVCEYRRSGAIGLSDAVSDLSRMLKGDLPAGHYGDNVLLPCLAASGDHVCMMAANASGEHLQNAHFHLGSMVDRIRLLCVFANLYQLFGLMVSHAPPPSSRQALFVKERRSDGRTTIEVLPGCVRKRIKDFADRPSAPHTTFEVVQKAYARAAWHREESFLNHRQTVQHGTRRAMSSLWIFHRWGLSPSLLLRRMCGFLAIPCVARSACWRKCSLCTVIFGRLMCCGSLLRSGITC